jgi:protein-S-isoprenylcysteine O-methyltransferase Ste14
MFDKASLAILLSKVPDLRKPTGILLTLLYTLLLAALCGLFFYSVDRLAWYGPLLSQLIMALIVTSVSYVHFKLAPRYRQRYGPLAYRAFFYHLMLPYLVTWYACFFHPLFVAGPALLPRWLSIGLGLVFLLLFFLADAHIERAGFQMITHGLDLYTVFPKEATVVYGQIYGYIRHPLYFALICGCLGLGLLRNNALSLVVALLHVIPALAVGYMEDRELIQRAGGEHRAYIQRTAALLPLRRMGGFLKLLLFRGK